MVVAAAAVVLGWSVVDCGSMWGACGYCRLRMHVLKDKEERMRKK